MIAIEKAIAAHQEKVLRAHRVRNAGQLVELVDALGFAFAFTLRTGDAPIPACFDHLSTNDEGRKWGWMWGWKDELAEEKKVYYGTLLARKPTFVSMKLLPTFYATFGRAGESDDHLDDVRAGRLSDVARRIIDFLSQNGETQTKRMRAELGITSKEGRATYGKAIDEVQRLMYVARVRAVGEGREDYNYTYDLFVRRYPETVKAAERLSSADATASLLVRTLELAGALTEKQLLRLFDWDETVAQRAVARAEATKKLVRVNGSLVLPALYDGRP
ncbi:MAG TPA: crosslink repair DNA glycosylase YcaQ family protein [Candidatus Limnocylindria bacterium]|nr:crosslink repair DNA glycosylase YcaQ family protein [Candidatus Limnocylindria bacterium]